MNSETRKIIEENYLTLPVVEVGRMAGVSRSRVCQIAQEIGMPSKRAVMDERPKNKSYAAYRSWAAMIQRCKTVIGYIGRVSVCERWRKFDNFIEDMGERPKGFTLDRKNPNGNYEKENCRWIPKHMQAKTTRRYLAIGPCVDCQERRGNKAGRCHRCAEYFRRTGRPRPNKPTIISVVV